MSPILVCIHGWGGSKESFTELRAALDGTDIQLLTPDLPGFGAEPDPSRPWTNDEYADWVEQWLQNQESVAGGEPRKERGIRNQEIQLLGHSHGGRIAIKLANRQGIRNQPFEALRPSGPNGESGIRNFQIKHLFLCAAAGIPHAPTFKELLGLIAAKSGKAILSIPGLRSLQASARKILYKILDVHDYERASPVMKETLRLVTDEDLTPLLRSIDLPTDIFWGKDDRMTPFSDALIMEREISGSILHSFENVRHGIHRAKAQEIAEVIRGRIVA